MSSRSRVGDAVVVRNLSLAFGAKQILRRLAFRIPLGSKVVFVGANGVGKTTLQAVMAMVLRRGFSGELNVFGFDAGPDIPDRSLARLRRNVGVLWQHALVELDATCFQNVAAMAAIRGVPRLRRRSFVQQALELAGLSRRADDRANTLNGGDKRLLSLARAIVGLERGILFADEPTANMSDESRDRILSLFQRLNKGLGLTLVVVTHDLNWAQRLTPHVWRLEGGRLQRVDFNQSGAKRACATRARRATLPAHLPLAMMLARRRRPAWAPSLPLLSHTPEEERRRAQALRDVMLWETEPCGPVTCSH